MLSNLNLKKEKGINKEKRLEEAFVRLKEQVCSLVEQSYKKLALLVTCGLSQR